MAASNYWDTYELRQPDRQMYESRTGQLLKYSDLKCLPNVLQLIIVEYGSTLMCKFTSSRRSCLDTILFDSIGTSIELSAELKRIHQNIKDIRIIRSVYYPDEKIIIDQLSNMIWRERIGDISLNTLEWINPILESFPNDGYIMIDNYPEYDGFKYIRKILHRIPIIRMHKLDLYHGELKFHPNVF